MTILDKLVERKDVEKYIDARIWKLIQHSRENIKKIEPKQRQLWKKQITGRIKELREIKGVVKERKEKYLGQKYWEDTRAFRESSPIWIDIQQKVLRQRGRDEG